MEKNKDIKRLKPSLKTIKKLFALSGNICAFGDCKEQIISNEGTVVGDICHIVAAEKDGPRSFTLQEFSNDYRRSYDNLILLCKKHHKIIDDNEFEYTVEKLQNMKKEHEEKFRENKVAEKLIESFTQPATIDGEVYRLLYDIHDLTNSANKTAQQILNNMQSSFEMDLSDFIGYLANEISEEKICFLHGKMMEDFYPDYLRGVYRKEEAWVGPKGCKKENCTMETIEPEKINEEMDKFISSWKDLLNNKSEYNWNEKLSLLAQLHLKFLKIHPFHDGNGRVSRVILIAQVFQLENYFINNPFINKNEYYLSLREADHGDFKRLERIIAREYSPKNYFK